jgi:hypothetical protein
MTTQRKVEVLGALALAVMLIVVTAQWVKSREAMIRAEGNVALLQAAKAAASQQMQANDAAAVTFAATKTQQADAVKTPQQADDVIAASLTSLQPKSSPAQTVATVKAGDVMPTTLPDAPKGTVLTVLTPEQSEALAKATLQCEATANTLNACTLDKQLLAKQLDDETKEAAQWKSVASGGTVLQRVTRVAKYAACAGVGAGGGSLADRVESARGAAIGGVFGVALCAVLVK